MEGDPSHIKHMMILADWPGASHRAAKSRTALYNPCVVRLSVGADLDLEGGEWLQRLCERPRKVAAGKPLVNEGEASRHIFAVLKGYACHSRQLQDGGRQIISLILPGDFSNYQASALGGFDHAVITLTACTVAEISGAALDEAIQRAPDLARVLAAAARAQAAILREKVVSLGRRGADQRLAHLFCEVRVRLQAAGLAESGAYHFPLTQEELADALGLSNVHVNRQLQKLRQEELLEWTRGWLTILDVDRLEAFAGFQAGYLQLR